MVQVSKDDLQFNKVTTQILSGSDSRHRILRSTVYLAAQKGVDQITVAEVIKQANVSRNTLYSHFGDIPGVFAELWILCGEAWFARLASTDIDTGPLSNIDRVMYSLLAISPRSPEISEVVTRTVLRFWTRAADTPLEQLHIAWRISSHVGVQLSCQTTPGVLQVVDAINASLKLIPENESFTPIPIKQTSQSSELPLPIIINNVDVDDVTNSLLSSAITVVGNVGLASATLMRICRLAGVTTGSMTSRFASLHELLDASFDAVSTRIISDNALDLMKIDPGLSLPESNALFVDLALASERRWWRRYRTELLVAAWNNPELAAFISSSMAKSNEILLIGMEQFGVPKEILHEVAALNTTYALGMAVLHEIGLPVKGLQHQIPIALIFEHLSNT